MTDDPTPGAPSPDPPPTSPTPAASSTPAASPPRAEAGAPADPLFASTADLRPVEAAVDGLRREIGRVVVGQHAMVDELVACLLAGGHALIEGVPGVAKTLTARLLARATGLDYARIQFTPDLMPADVLGTSVFRPQHGDFEFHPGPVFAQVVLIDEINRAPAKTQAALFEVMEERQATVDGTRYPMPAPFTVLATQNPIEHEGTYNLPEAQLDRFLFKIVVGYPGLEDEVEMLERFQRGGGRVALDAVEPVLDAAGVERAQAVVRSIRAETPVLRYAAEIVDATRSHPALALGASPRATLALLQGAKAVAAMSGRDFATPDDVKSVVAPALRHRVLLTADREIEGARVEAVLRQLTAEVEVPR